MMIGCDGTVQWKSSNVKIVNVDTEGTVRLLKTGSVTITAMVANTSVKAVIKFNITNPAKTIEIIGGESIGGGKTLKLTAKVTGDVQDLTPAAHKVVWSIAPEDAAYASINMAGVLKAENVLASHTVRVYATVDGSSIERASHYVTVSPITTGITLRSSAGNTIDIRSMQQVHLLASCQPMQANQDVTWSCSNKSVTIREDGMLVLPENVKPGTIVITATAKDGSNKKASLRLNLICRMAEDDLTVPESLHIAGGTSIKIPVSVVNASNKQLDWRIDGTAWASITNGILKARKVTGQKTVYVTVSAKDGSGVGKTCCVTIYPQTVSVRIFRDNQEITGTTQDFWDGMQLQIVNSPIAAMQCWSAKTSNAAVSCEVNDRGILTLHRDNTKKLSTNTKVTVTVTANDGSKKSAKITLIIR